tara:strand:- start:3199 stop:3456 length:258 start_codon:yes stop_codon:yes gene_type:complete
MATTPGIKTKPKPRARKAPAKRKATAPVVTHTQAQLDGHERECAARYASVLDKLKALDKRMFRMEATNMTSTIAVIGLVIATFLK